MIKFKQYLLENNNGKYDWKKDLNDPSYDDGTHDKIMAHRAKVWVNEEGEYHRENDKPAYIHVDWRKCWYINGKLHRENDKPAVIDKEGNRTWFIDGKKHRENDKPASITRDNIRFWYVDDKKIEPKLNNYLAALYDDPSYIKIKDFRNGIEEFGIPFEIQEKLIQIDPSISKHIRNLDSKFSHLGMGNKFGVFDD